MLIGRMLEELAPTFWICGVFDSRRELVRRLSNSPLPRNLVFELLYTIDPPASVAVARGSSRLTCTPFTVVHPLADGSIMKIVLLYEASPIAPPSEVTQRLRGILESNDFGTPSAAQSIEQNPSIVRSRRPGQLAIFTIDSAFRIVGSWLSAESPTAEMRSIVSPRGDSLPLFIETSVREATVGWNWETGENCAVAVTSPIPQLIVRAIPMREGAMLHMVVLVELLHVRYTLASAQHDFRLSDREVQVLQLLFEGRRGSDIANALYLAESTVQDHIKHAIAKTGSSNRVEMTAKILGWSRRDRGSS